MTRFQWNVNSIYHAICWVYITALKLESPKAYGQQYKGQQDQETHYTSVHTKCEEFILIDEVMNAEEGNFYVSLELLWQGIKSLSPWFTWLNEPQSPGMDTGSAYMDTDSAYCGSVIGETR